MDVKKEAIFRVQIVDLKTKKSKVLTVYSNDDILTLEQFKQKIINAIKGDAK